MRNDIWPNRERTLEAISDTAQWDVLGRERASQAKGRATSKREV